MSDERRSSSSSKSLLLHGWTAGIVMRSFEIMGEYCTFSTSPAAGVTVTINICTGGGGGGAGDL